MRQISHPTGEGNVSEKEGGFFGSLLALCVGAAVVVAPVAGWITHLVICFQENRWGFLIAGAIFFPIGIIHGIGRWFGWW